VVSKPVWEVSSSSAGCQVPSVSCSSRSGLALLVVLESLGPGERLVFVRYDLCALPFDANGLAGVMSWREDGTASIRTSPCSRRIPSTSASGSTTPPDAVACALTGPPTPFKGEHQAGPLVFFTRPNAFAGLGPLCTKPDTSTPPATCSP
jgi:hypothetical protein